jgi:two-component system CheB/CheR fusion protein
LKIVSSNASFHEAFDLKSSAIRGRRLDDIANPLFAQESLFEALSRARQPGARGETVELEAQQPNHARRFWRASAGPIRCALAERPSILLAFQDTTDERRVARRQLQMIIDASPTPILAVDGEGRMRLANKAVEPLFGYAVEELIGREVEMLAPAALRSRHALLSARYLAHPVPRSTESGLDIMGEAKDGKEIPLDFSLNPLTTTEGLFVLTAIHDLRPQKQIQAKLSEAKAEADRANRAKSRFLAAASHDLRQPLQTIGLLLGVLRKRTADSEAKTVLRRLDETVAGMAELLDSLLDVKQIESGGIQPSITDFPVAALLAHCAEEFDELAAAKGLKLRIAPSSLTIRSDRHLLERIVNNLLSNAVKYTDRGGILLGCRRRGDTLRIEVWDTGIGIPEDHLSAVFEEFHRVDRNDASTYGLGLGLSIVERFAQILGHTVEVRSRLGEGTMFAVVAPLAARQAAPPPDGRGHGSGAPPPTILLVEDDPMQLQTLHALMELEGYRVATARKGDEALAAIRGPAAIRPDALVCDQNLPGEMKGLEVVRRLRRELGAQVPALIVTGDKSADVRRALKSSGLDCLVKPVKAEKLLAAVEALVKIAIPDWGAAGKPARALTSPSPENVDAEVGVVDDDPDVREALRMVLEAAGRRVAAYSSAEALLADPGRTRLRCVVADLGLPGIDGLALQSRLRSERTDARIVFVTGHSELPTAVKAMRAGAVDFLLKPVNAADLVASVANALESGIESANLRVEQADVEARIAALTEREQQVMKLMLTGEATKNVAADLGISIRTAEHHRQSVMRKMAAKSLAMLVRMVAGRAQAL